MFYVVFVFWLWCGWWNYDWGWSCPLTSKRVLEHWSIAAFACIWAFSHCIDTFIVMQQYIILYPWPLSGQSQSIVVINTSLNHHHHHHHHHRHCRHHCLHQELLDFDASPLTPPPVTPVTVTAMPVNSTPMVAPRTAPTATHMGPVMFEAGGVQNIWVKGLAFRPKNVVVTCCNNNRGTLLILFPDHSKPIVLSWHVDSTWFCRTAGVRQVPGRMVLGQCDTCLGLASAVTHMWSEGHTVNHSSLRMVLKSGNGQLHGFWFLFRNCKHCNIYYIYDICVFKIYFNIILRDICPKRFCWICFHRRTLTQGSGGPTVDVAWLRPQGAIWGDKATPWPLDFLDKKNRKKQRTKTWKKHEQLISYVYICSMMFHVLFQSHLGALARSAGFVRVG